MYHVFRKNKKNLEPPKNVIDHPRSQRTKIKDFGVTRNASDVKDISQCGDFGTVPVKQSKEVDLKVKVLKTDCAAKGEGSSEMFNHRNLKHIMKLEFTENRYSRKSDSYLFYKPVEIWSIDKRIKERQFIKDPLALIKLLNWLKEICDVTHYLHTRGFALLNIQPQNIVINEEDVIQITNFQYISSLKKRCNRFGVCQNRRSPESFFDNKGEWEVRPEKFDTWSIGMLIIDLFTDFYLSKKLPSKVSNWSKEVYPILHDALKKKKFSKLVRNSFPKAHGTVNLLLIQELSSYALSIEASRRPSAKELYHLFIMMKIQMSFSSTPEMELPKESVWVKKVNWKNMENLLSRLSTEENIELLREENVKKIRDQISTNERKGLVLKPVTSELYGVKLNKTRGIFSNIDEPRESIEDRTLCIGDASPNREVSYSNSEKVSSSETKRKMKIEKEEKEREMKITMKSSNEKKKMEIDSSLILPKKAPKKPPRKPARTSPLKLPRKPPIKPPRKCAMKALQYKTASNNKEENKKIDQHLNDENEESSSVKSSTEKEEIIEFTSQRETDCSKKSKESNHSEKFFRTGMQLVNGLLSGIKWTYDVTSSNFEITSSNNYLHNLSKRLTK